MKIKFEKEYHGFESINELCNGEDICWWLEHEAKIPGEFQGTLKVTITYEPADGE